MQASVVEQSIGINTFFSEYQGINGNLRTLPSDFRVCEIPLSFSEASKAKFSIAKITAENWETNHLIRVLSKKLHISRKRISFAGTKDKRSISTQYFSFYRVKPDKIKEIYLKDVSIDEVFASKTGLHLGDLVGNDFRIIVRNIENNMDLNTVQSCFISFQKIQGFPNFFGVQRFGIIRPLTHIVGKHLVEGDFEKAVMTYLTAVFEDDNTQCNQIRKQLATTGDIKQALIDFPNHLQFEKAMLNHLVGHPDDYIGALKQLPNNLLTMFVYAFQSYLFNKMLSKRIQMGLPLHQAIEGDVVLPVRHGQILDECVPVSSQNIDKVNKQLKKKKGYVSSILLGSDSTFSKGMMGEIEHRIVEDEQIDYRNFIIPELPAASSYGKRRALFAPLENLSYSIRDDSINSDKKAVTVSFRLLKGCYATSFLREIMKAKDITQY
ncbi:MAG: tRNA pseudouridine(13) synthase TruD [Thermoplasmatota archaeon]